MPKPNRILSVLGLNVRKARETKRFTQEKLAERAGLDPTYISGIERERPNRKRNQYREHCRSEGRATRHTRVLRARRQKKG